MFEVNIVFKVVSAVSKPQSYANKEGSSENCASIIHIGSCDWVIEGEIEPNHDETRPNNRGNVHRKSEATE